jgi:putative chitinase
MTPAELQAAIPSSGARALTWAAPLTAAMSEYSITTPRRVAAFLAQVAHESASFRYVKELGSAAYLDKYDTGPLAARLGNTPADDNDGQKYCGRGLIQLTGRSNYSKLAQAFGLPLLETPELLEQPGHAARSAGWFWSVNDGLNRFADVDHFGELTKRINGGFNGLDDRLGHWLTARKALGL